MRQISRSEPSRQDVQGAIQTYEKGLALDGTYANAWLALGNLYQGEGDLESAVAAYDQACAFVDHGKNGCPAAAAIYMKLGRYELAADRYQVSINQIGYYWAGSEQGLANALLALGRTEEAIPHLRILAEHGSKKAQELLTKIDLDQR